MQEGNSVLLIGENTLIPNSFSPLQLLYCVSQWHLPTLLPAVGHASSPRPTGNLSAHPYRGRHPSPSPPLPRSDLLIMVISAMHGFPAAIPSTNGRTIASIVVGFTGDPPPIRRSTSWSRTDCRPAPQHQADRQRSIRERTNGRRTSTATVQSSPFCSNHQHSSTTAPAYGRIGSHSRPPRPLARRRTQQRRHLCSS